MTASPTAVTASHTGTVKSRSDDSTNCAFGAWPRFGADPWILIPFAIVLLAPFQAGEEVGWRGYALVAPEYADRFPASLRVDTSALVREGNVTPPDVAPWDPRRFGAAALPACPERR